MSDLYPCPACRRHVRAEAESCPFCGETAVAPAKRKPFAGKLTRAAIFAGALAGGAAVAGCGPETPPNNPDQVQKDDQQDNDQKQSDGVESGTADAAPVVQEPVYDPNDVPKPYGAPPARRRIV